MPTISVELPALDEDPWGEKLLAALAAVVAGINNSLTGAAPASPLGQVASAGSPAGPGAAADHVHPTTGLATAADLANAVIGAGGVPPTRAISTGAGLSGGGDLTTDRTLAVVFGTTAGTVAAGDDTRVAGAVQADSTLGLATTNLARVKVTGDLVPRFAIRADGTIAHGEPPVAISNVTGTTTVTVTTADDHSYATGDKVTTSGIGGFTGATGNFTVTRVNATQFTLDGATGSGTYTTGGMAQRVFGGVGAVGEGIWNLVADGTRTALAIRGREGDSNHLTVWFDYLGQPAFVVPSFGGPAVLGDNFRVHSGSDIFNSEVNLKPDGTGRFRKGDSAGGAGVLALGNATTAPTGNPDGTHTVDGATTDAGIVGWARDGRLRLLTSAGHDGEILPGVGVGRRLQSLSAAGGGTTLILEGLLPPTEATTDITASADDQAGGPLVKYLTSAASDVDAGVISAPSVVQARWAPYFFARIMTDASAVTSTRLWVGLSNSELGGLATVPTTQHLAAFRYDSGLDGTAFWRAVTCGGTAATVTATTAAIAADTSYELAIEVDAAGTAVRFWVGGVLVATHATNLPGVSTGLGFIARLRTLAASARALRFGRIAISQK